MGHATSDEYGRTAATMPCPPSPFLPVDLGSRPVDFRAAFGTVGSLARIGQLANQCLVHKATINFGVKYAGRQFDAAYFLTSHIENWDFH
jgi:hypothetical protein